MGKSGMVAKEAGFFVLPPGPSAGFGGRKGLVAVRELEEGEVG